MKKVILAVVVFVMMGCSSIVSKSEYSVAINSVPNGANFEIINRSGQKVQSGVTPNSVVLKSSSGYFKGETYTINIVKDGFIDKTYTMQSSMDGWYIGNILFGGLIGMLIVDPATGAMYNLPDRVDINLDEESEAEDQMTLNIDSFDSLSPQQIARLVPLNVK